MTIIEQNRSTDLHMRVTHAPLTATFCPMTTEMQENLRNDVKALVAEYLEHMKAPAMLPAAWQAATVEILSEDTVRYIRSLEELLEGVLADPDADEEFVARIKKVLR